jgi:hypothetical protein
MSIAASDPPRALFATAPKGIALPEQACRMVAKDPQEARTCPCCGRRTRRVRRHFTDRLRGLFVPMLRYRCEAPLCGWEGLVRRGLPGTVEHEPRAYVPRHRLEASCGAASPPRAEAFRDTETSSMSVPTLHADPP